MKTKAIKRCTSLLMALVMCVTAMLGLGVTAFAAGEQADVYMVAFPRDGDANYSNTWGHGDITYMNGWHSGSSRHLLVRAMNSFEGQACFCIEPGVPLDVGDTLTNRGEDFWDNYPSSYNSTIDPDTIKLMIGRILQYGYNGNITTSWRSQNEADANALSKCVATQLLIWETVIGERDENFNHVSTGSYGRVTDQIGADNPLHDRIMSFYNSIASDVQTHSKIPSFMAKSTGKAQTIELNWDGSKYVAELTDTNGVLGNYNFAANVTGINFSVSGNKLIITADKAPESAVTITASKINSQRKGLVVWTDSKIGPNGGLQDLITYAQSVTDPVKAYLQIKVSYGSAKIIKTSEDGNVGGITFTITGNGVNETVQTNSKGEFQIDNLAPGTYTVTEMGYDRYEPQEARKVTVVSGQTATVSFNNVLKRGELTVTKTSEDGLVEGVTFHLYGTSLSGIPVDQYAVTGSNGIAAFEDVLIGSGYVLEEVDTEVRYVIPDDQTAAVNWHEVTGLTVNNVLKKFNVTVIKKDAEAGTAQGDGSLAGAVYGIYKGDELIDTYTTDANGQFTTDYYVCGDNWSIREISASEGYLVDGASHHVGAEPETYTVELNSTSMNVTETVIKGNVAIIKHTDNGETQIETPEEGAIFAIYRKAAGSFDAAKESERDYLTCDENGFAQSKDMPYGIYTVHQISGWDGRELMPDFDVYISENGMTYRYLINNACFESYIKVIKVDAETGNRIPYAGAGFKLYYPDGSQVAMTITYPTQMTIDTFYTNEEGYLITPEQLPYGEGYTLYEVQAPYGYTLNTDPVHFNVTQDASDEEGGITVIEVTKSNTAQKGVINISKSGEVFFSVTESNGVYQPVYEVKGLPGAVYEVTAAEDVYTLDGTLRASAGEVVDTVTTDANGEAVTKELYLGKYTVKEIEAPAGMVLNDAVHEVELVYAGQEVSVTETSTSYVNERQKAALDLKKVMESDSEFGIGKNNEVMDVSFGIFAAEELTAMDGSTIPADGLMEIVSVNADGKAEFATDLPFGSYYVTEMATNSAYILSDARYPVSFEYAGQDTALVQLHVNGGNSIDNDIIRGAVSGMKVGEDGEGLSGAKIGLFKADAEAFTADTAIRTTISAENGQFGFEGVPYGTYVVKEIAAPEGFVMSDLPYTVVIDSEGKTVSFTIENTRIRGNVQLTKVDKDYPDHHLAGAVFDIYEDTNGNGTLDKDDVKLGTLEELADGVYEMDDLLYGGYFVKETKAPEGFFLDENVYAFSITENGKTVIVENEAGKGFINLVQTGAIRIEKTSEDKVVKGFTFKVEGTDITGNIFSKEYVTDENGEIHIENLRVGDYVISEVATKETEKYVLPDNITVTVLEGKTTVAKFYNELKPVIPDIPKTGDTTNIGLWTAIAGVSLAGAAVAAFFTFGKKRKGKHER